MRVVARYPTVNWAAITPTSLVRRQRANCFDALTQLSEFCRDTHLACQRHLCGLMQGLMSGFGGVWEEACGDGSGGSRRAPTPTPLFYYRYIETLESLLRKHTDIDLTTLGAVSRGGYVHVSADLSADEEAERGCAAT